MGEIIVSKKSLEDALKENNIWTGLKKAKAYYQTKDGLFNDISKELAMVELEENSLDSRKKAYNQIQVIGDKYFRGIDAGRDILFFGTSSLFWSYYGIGLAKSVADFSQISTPVVKELAQLVEKPLRFVADKIPYALPHFDKAGHLGMGLAIGRTTEWFAENVLSWYNQKKPDVDDVAEDIRKSFLVHFGFQAGATYAWAMLKENIDEFAGGVKSLADVGATMGGQALNGLMSYARSRKYSVVINEMRVRLYELGMDDDGKPLSKNAGYYDIKVPFLKASAVKKAIHNAKGWTDIVK